MKQLIYFFIAFVILTFALSFILYFSPLTNYTIHFYYSILKSEMNAYFYIFEDGVVEVKMGTTTKVDVKAEIIKDPGKRRIFFQKTFTQKVGKVAIGEPQIMRSRSQYLRSLTLNIIPMIALMIATPGMGIYSWKRKLIYLILALIALNISHFCHIYLFYLSNFFPVRFADVEWLKKLVGDLFVFWESLGRPISPLIIWLLFYNRLLFKPAREVE